MKNNQNEMVNVTASDNPISDCARSASPAMGWLRFIPRMMPSGVQYAQVA